MEWRGEPSTGEILIPARGQAGIALIPAMIAMAITAVAVIALFSALTTILLSTGAQRRTVRAGNEGTTAIEVLKSLSYSDCRGSANWEVALAGAYTPPTGYTVDITGVEYISDAASSNPSFQSSCPSVDQGVQRITVRVSASGTPDVFEDVQGIVRRDTCPAAIGPQPGEKC